MKTVESTWRNLAKGYERISELEYSFQQEWAPQVKQAQRQKYEAEFDSWKLRLKQRNSDHKDALSTWEQEVSDQRLRLRTATGSGVRRTRVAVPVSVFLLMLAALLEVIETNATELIWPGIYIGLAIAFAPAAWSAIQFMQLQSKKPEMIAVVDPMPKQENPIRLTLTDQWWQQISDNGTHQSKATADYGDVGEEQFYRHLTQSLPDDHVGLRGILVKQCLDVDHLVVGPTNIWIFEVKHWKGTITCRDGNWRRSKPYYAPGGILSNEEQEIKSSFDHQWVRERREVQETLRRHVRPANLANRIAGGLVFTHPEVILNIDQSCGCEYGRPVFWTTRLQKAAAERQKTISQFSKLSILDALLDRAERIDHTYAQRRCCIELADRLADDMTNWAKDYVADRLVHSRAGRR